MTDAELMARAEVITDAVIEAAVNAGAEVSDEVRIDILDKIYGKVRRGINDVMSYVPYVAFIVGLKLSAGWMGHCISAPWNFWPDHRYMKAPPKKAGADAGGPAPAATDAVAQTDNEELLAQLYANNFYNAHL